MANRGQLYSVEGDRLVRKNEFCPRCGPGVFLATHHDRRSCGRCGFRLESQGDVVAPAEVEAEAPAEEPTEEPAEEPPAGEPAEAPGEEPAEVEAEAPSEAPVEEPAEAPPEGAVEEAADPAE